MNRRNLALDLEAAGNNQVKYFGWITKKMETLDGSPVPSSEIFKDNISYDECKKSCMSIPEFHLVYVVDCKFNEMTGRKTSDAIYPLLVCSVEDGFGVGIKIVQLTEVGQKFAKDMTKEDKATNFMRELSFSYMKWQLPTEDGTVNFTCKVDSHYSEHIDMMHCNEIECAKLFLNLHEAIAYRKLFFDYHKQKFGEDKERREDGIFTIDEIATALGIDKWKLKILKDADIQNYEGECYYDGNHPENYGDIEYMSEC